MTVVGLHVVFCFRLYYRYCSLRRQASFEFARRIIEEHHHVDKNNSEKHASVRLFQYSGAVVFTCRCKELRQSDLRTFTAH